MFHDTLVDVKPIGDLAVLDSLDDRSKSEGGLASDGFTFWFG
jgi:hypothetical protein